MKCVHNQRCRYTDGFYCEDCNTYFGESSPTYRSGELLSSLWMVMHNINAEASREGGTITEAIEMRDKIGIRTKHENYEEIIAEAELIAKKYGKDAKSASFTLTKE